MGAVEDVPDGLAVFLLQNPLHPVHLLLHLQTQQVLNIWLAANMDAIADKSTQLNLLKGDNDYWSEPPPHHKLLGHYQMA